MELAVTIVLSILAVAAGLMVLWLIAALIIGLIGRRVWKKANRAFDAEVERMRDGRY